MTTNTPTESNAELSAETGYTALLPHNRTTAVLAWRFNSRLALWTLGIAVVLAPCLYGWYAFQVRRHATAILARAKTLHEKGDWKGAATAFGQYLQIRPQDAEAILLQAQNFDKLNDQADQRQRAVSLYFEAIRTNPTRNDVRLRLAELLFESGRFEEAATQAREVAAALPDDVKAARILTRSLREQLFPGRRLEAMEVIRTFEEALARHRGDVSLSMGLAEVLRKFQDSLPAESRETATATADRAIDEMISQHPDDPEALLARYRYRKAYHLAGGDEDLAHARQQAPDHPEVLLASTLSAGNTDRALAFEYGEHLLKVASKNRRAYMTVAQLYTRWNESQEAIRVLEAGAEKIGRDDLELNRALLQLLLATESPEPAHADLAHADLAHADLAHADLAHAELARADLAREVLARIEPVFGKVEPYLQNAVRRRFHEDLDVARAQLQILEGNTTAALPALKRLAANVTESADPGETMAERQRRWRLLATAYARLGMHDRAASAFDELVRLDPRVKENRLQAANQWRLVGDYERAISHYDFATAGGTDLPAAWLGLVETRLDQQLRKVAGEVREWAGVDAALKQAQAKLGDAPEMLNLRAVVAVARNDGQTALDCLHKLLTIKNLDLAVWFYAQQQRLPEARQVLQEMIAKVELTDLERELLLARGSDMTDDDDLRLQATLLLVRGGTENVRKGVSLLTELVDKRNQVQPGDRLLLARALENANRIDDAGKQYQAALKGGEPPAYLVPYVEFLVRNSLLDEAGRKLARLEEKEPAHPRLLELRVNWLSASKRSSEIEATVDRALAPRIDAAQSVGQRAALLRVAADLLVRAKLDQAVEKKLRQLAVLEPSGYEPLAVWLADHSRLDEALAVIVAKVAPADIAQKALVIVRVLTIAASRGDPKPTQFAAAEQVFVAAFSQPDAALLLETGVLRIMQGRNADAIAMYERALAKAPHNPAVFNNLAVALSEVPERRAEALRLIDKAIAQLPNSAELLDSKALVLTSAGRHQEAREILDRLCRLNRKNPRYRLHLAVALHHLQEANSSRNEIERAIADGLPAELLTPAERRQWRQISDQVADRS